MKRICTINVLFFLFAFATQAQFTEDFSDGDFTTNPTWTSDTIKFQVNSGQLQSNSNTLNNTFYLSTPSAQALTAQWELYIKLDFSTSSANYVDIYLMADQQNLKSSLNGYFVRLGGTPDEISLYRKDGSVITKIIDGLDGRSQSASSNNQIKLKVRRTATNDWILEDDITGTGNSFFTEGLVNDNTYLTSSFFGISVTQSTASFFSKHYFDNIYVGALIVDIVPPIINSINVISNDSISVLFNEPVEQVSAETASFYTVNNAIGSPQIALRDATNFALVHLKFSTAFSSGVINTLTINDVRDISNNPIAVNSNVTFVYYNTVVADSFDIVINEVLFNSRTGADEFLELYNRSTKVIDLKNMQITKRDLLTREQDAPIIITNNTRLLLPGEYVVLTDDSTRVKSEYKTGSAVFVNMSLPDLLTEEDIVLLLDATSKTIDEFHYYSVWQFPLLNTVDGVSLERINPNRLTQDQTNWHSASETAGFATPGLRNSQFSDAIGDGSTINIQPEIFSPDNDGFDDVTNITYHFDQPGFTANVQVYDERGRLMTRLVQNQLLGTDGVWTWNGVNDKNEKARIGIYIVYMEAFNLNGDVKKYKKTCVVAGKL